MDPGDDEEEALEGEASGGIAEGDEGLDDEAEGQEQVWAVPAPVVQDGASGEDGGGAGVAEPGEAEPEQEADRQEEEVGEAAPEEPEETYEYTEQQVRDIRAAFGVYDEVLNETIPIGRLGCVLRSLALSPTEAELRAAAKWLDADPVRGVVRFKEFLIIMGRALKDPITEQKVLEGFRSMDRQATGLVSRAVLHDALTTTGEKLYPLEFAAFIKYADPKRKGVVKYEDFVRKMNSGKLDKKKRRKKKKGKKKKKKKKTKPKREAGADTSSSGSSCGELSV